MALRRPPTRIELKTEDMAEYDELRERQQEKLHPEPPAQQQQQQDGSTIPEQNNERKPSAAERIGLTRTAQR